MPRFEPFTGLRYNPRCLAERGLSLDDVIAPPYDVVDTAGRAALVERSELNAVRIELPEPADGLDRYQAAARLFAQWQADGVLQVDPGPAFYAYQMTFADGSGRRRRTSGVLGALEVSPPGSGEVLPHERTMPKPKGDRLDLLRACKANISPVWGLSLASGLSSCLEMAGPVAPAAGAVAPAAGAVAPAAGAVAVDGDGVIHELAAITDPEAISRIAAIVASSPVLLADGHHRYETSLAYREERREASGGAPGDYDRVLALVVELAEDQLAIGPIHRLLSGLPDGYDLVKGLSGGYELSPVSPGTAGAAGPVGPVLVTRAGWWLMRARDELVEAAEDDLDSGRLDLALQEVDQAELSYHHDPAEVIAAVREGRADAGALVRPATVAVIQNAARHGRRLPAKSTFFTPKPRTGMVFRLLR